ncbi:MAG TPA: hypothetical protein VIY48_01435 [Candidatus Paceibacterota bacterium]
MGYKVPKQIFKLVFPAHDGLVIRITAPTIGEVMSLTRLIKYRGANPDTLDESDVEELRRPQRIFAKHLISWNLTDDVWDDIREENIEIDVPSTVEGVESLPGPFFKEIVQAWVENTVEVPDQSPLDKRSLNGLRFPEESIPMEIPSLSLKN